LVSSCQKKSEDLLFDYIESNDVKNVEKLIKDGVDINYLRKGNFPLTLAAKKGNLPIVKLLIKNGARIQSTEHGMTPLRGAVYSDNIEIMNYLIEHGANVNYKNQHGESILMTAAKGGNLKIIKLLLKHGAKVNDKDDDNASALFYYIKLIGYFDSNALSHTDYLNTAKVLIEAGADVNNSDSKGVTVLMLACASRQIEVIKMLIEAGADVNKRDKKNYGDIQGKTALDIVKENEFKEGEKLLRKHGAKTAQELDNEKIKCSSFEVCPSKLV
jgi:ankyrin repeat protein